MNSKVYLVSGKRTPYGSFGGTLSSINPVDLTVTAGKAVLDETGVAADKIDHVILGNVIPSTSDTLYGARHVALKLGCPQEVPGYNINRLCGSGIQVMIDATNMIRLGEANCLLVGGVENMSQTPHLTYGGRFGTKYGALKQVDLLMDALTDSYCQTPMGVTAENLADQHKISREECDQFALKSHQRATKAYDENLLQGEIVSIEHRKGVLSEDEHLRKDASIESMAKLRPSFKKDGVVTAANASGIVDGASVVMIASEEFCQANGLKPIAEIIDSTVVGVDPSIMGIGPVPAVNKLLERNKLTLDQIDLVEINEAFASQTLSCMKELGLSEEKVNIWGGAIALGHPLGASGTRIATTLARQLQHLDLDYGIATACIGGGQGIGLLIKKC